MVPPKNSRVLEEGITVLTADLVQVRLRDGEIKVRQLSAANKQSLLKTATLLSDGCQSNLGESRGRLLNLWGAITTQSSAPKLAKGLQKLLLDRCTFEDTSKVDPRVVRKSVFRKAAAYRKACKDEDFFKREAVIDTAAEELGLEPGAVINSLFSDLKENHTLVAFDNLGAQNLVEHYERSQRQAVLLRAVKVNIKLKSGSPNEYRTFFQKLKFRRLLYTIVPLEAGGYEITIDGPFSLFQALTKYGLQLALMLPVLEECSDWAMEADIAWGKTKERYSFKLNGKKNADAQAEAPWISEDVRRLHLQLSERTTEWQVEHSDDLLNLPGFGVCVPDLTFTHKETGQKVYLEVMGYWSRNAVWKRVELVEAGLPHPIIFAVGKRLRVSEDILDDSLPSQIYVYKGVMLAKSILERLEQMLT